MLDLAPATNLLSGYHENQAVRSRLSLLELLHPHGQVTRARVLGPNCPDMLLPEACIEVGRQADLIIVAPTPEECRNPSWLEQQIQAVVGDLAVDGMVYLLAPSPWRLKMIRLLRRYGLVTEMVLVHLPDWSLNHYILPLQPAVIRYACSKLLPLPAWKRFLAGIVFHLPGSEKLLAAVLPSVGVVARHPGAPALLDWLFRGEERSVPHGSAIINPGWRGSHGTVILYRFASGDTMPSAIAKMNLMMKQTNEADILRRLGPVARQAGAQTPRVLSVGQVGGHPVLLQTKLNGQSLSALLASRPERFFEQMERIISWLEQWSQLTRIVKPLDQGRLTRELLAPAAVLAPLIRNGASYQEWLVQRCAEVRGDFIPLIAAHNDLTLENILLDQQGRLGIIDWETGQPEAFPLVDFFYAVTDAAAVGQIYEDRVTAFEACFASEGIYADQVAQWIKRLSGSVGLRVDRLALCFHACWLHHALNEHRASTASAAPPFLQIVQRLALAPAGIEGLIEGCGN